MPPPYVDLNADGQPTVETIVKGDTVREVLNYVQYNDGQLLDKLQASVEIAVREGRLDHTEAGRFLKFYEDGLHGYTYLEEPENG